MYKTFLAGSPWVKTVSFSLKVAIDFPGPAESRNNFTSKATLFDLAFLGAGEDLKGARATATDGIHNNGSDLNLQTVQYSTVLKNVRILELSGRVEVVAP